VFPGICDVRCEPRALERKALFFKGIRPVFVVVPSGIDRRKEDHIAWFPDAEVTADSTK